MDDDLGGVGADLSTFERGVARPEELQRTARKREHIRARAHVRDLPAVACGVDRERIDRAGGQRSGVSPGQRAAVTERGVVGRRAVAIGSQDSGGRAVKAHHVASADLTHADYSGRILHQSPAKDVIGAAARGGSRDGARGSGLIEEHRTARGTRDRAANRERAAGANGHRVDRAGGDGKVADVLITGSEGERAAAEGGARGRAERTARDAQRAPREARRTSVIGGGAGKRPSAGARLEQTTAGAGTNRAAEGAITGAREREGKTRTGDRGGAGKRQGADIGRNRGIGAEGDGAAVGIGTAGVDERTRHAGGRTRATQGERFRAKVESALQGERGARGDRDGAAGADCGSVLQIEHPGVDGRRAGIGIGAQEEERPRPGLRQSARSAVTDRVGEGNLEAVRIESRITSECIDATRGGNINRRSELQSASIVDDRKVIARIRSKIGDRGKIDSATVKRDATCEGVRPRKRQDPSTGLYETGRR